jgi:hypothetical protein
MERTSMYCDNAAKEIAGCKLVCRTDSATFQVRSFGLGLKTQIPSNYSRIKIKTRLLLEAPKLSFITQKQLSFQ